MSLNGTEKKQIIRRNLRFLVLSVLAFSCAEATSTAVVTTCQLPSDQSATLIGYWNLKPVPIAFHAGDWSSAEMSAIVSAADSWNRFFTTSQKFQMIDYGTASSPRTSSISIPSGGPCSASITGTQYSAPVVLYKDSTWPSAYAATAIAITRTCTNQNATTSVKPLTMAYIEVNYQNYFTTSQKPDLQSILLHELGHLTGLDHSCESSKANFPTCASSTTYSDAVMAPIFTFDSSGNGQVKRSLTANDEGRANCLYDGGINGTTTN